MKTLAVSGKLDRIPTELLVIFAVDTADKKQGKPAIKVLAGGAAAKATASIVSSGEFAAGSCETALLHAPDGCKAKRILLVGLGTLSTAEVRKAAGTAVRFAKPRKLRELSIVVPEGPNHAGLDPAAAARAVVEGAYIGDFDPDTYRSDRKDQSIEQLNVAGSGAAVEAGVREGVILGEAQNFTRTLVNEPSNVMTPTVLGERAAAMCSQYGVKCEVFGADKLKELKMGAFWGVTKGSQEPPALIVMTYEPQNAPKNASAAPVLGLVGKGITFDTGGISIKPADGMEKM
jgi:leucyl aminopeptidase